MSAWKRSRPGSIEETEEPADASPDSVASSPAERPAAGDKAAQLLAGRPHFRRELEVKLTRAGYERGEIAEVLDRLVHLRLLDDETLARSFVETVARRKGWGRMRVAQELGRRGAPEAAIHSALADLTADADLEAAREAARRWRSRSRDDSSALARHLSRRGFTSNAIFKVLKEMAPLDSAEEEELAPEG
ncbi:MAG: regulatory protein RecX [Thermoanaerobaculia bacterium]